MRPIRREAVARAARERSEREREIPRGNTSQLHLPAHVFRADSPLWPRR